MKFIAKIYTYTLSTGTVEVDAEDFEDAKEKAMEVEFSSKKFDWETDINDAKEYEGIEIFDAEGTSLFFKDI